MLERTAFLEKSDESDQRRREDLALLRAARTNSEGALNRLYELVEQALRLPVIATSPNA